MVGFGATALRRVRQVKGCTWVWGNGTEVAGQVKIRLLPTDFHKVVSASAVVRVLGVGRGTDYS